MKQFQPTPCWCICWVSRSGKPRPIFKTVRGTRTEVVDLLEQKRMQGFYMHPQYQVRKFFMTGTPL